jgi:hypothetical protein
MNVGIIAMRQDPHRIVCKLQTYRHPTVPNLRVTVKPIPSVAGPSFWNDHWYDQHVRYDRVVTEDGQLPVLQSDPKAAWYGLLRRVLVFSGQKLVVDTEKNLGKYEAPQAHRDRIESTLAYTNVVNQQDPPVDPRARRAVEHLNTIATSMESSGLADKSHHVVMPWSVYHVYYLRWRLPKDGWIAETEEEVLMIDRRQVAILSLMGGFLLAFTTWLFLRFLFGLFFW